MNEFELKDSGSRREFGTGSVRDADGNLKPRPDYMSPYALERFGEHMRKGAEKYGAWNWLKGQPVSEMFASMYRHMLAYQRGERDEDHLAAIIFGAQGIIHFEEKAKLGDETAFKMLDRYASHNLALDIVYEREAMIEADSYAETTSDLVQFVDSSGTLKVDPSKFRWVPLNEASREARQCWGKVFNVSTETDANVAEPLKVGDRVRVVRDINNRELMCGYGLDRVEIKGGECGTIEDVHDFMSPLNLLVKFYNSNLSDFYLDPEWVEKIN